MSGDVFYPEQRYNLNMIRLIGEKNMLSIDYVKKLNTLENHFLNSDLDMNTKWEYDMPLAIYGAAGSGKTTAALDYCAAHSHRVYFTFRNLSSDIAPKIFSEQYPDIFDIRCSDWESFFAELQKHFDKAYHVLVFDDLDDRNDKDGFLEALRKYIGRDKKRSPFVILVVVNGKSISIPCYSYHLQRYMPADIKRALPKMTDEDRMRLYSITDGLPALLSLYDEQLSFDDNLKSFFRLGSDFSRYGGDRLREQFHSSESYSGILIAVARGIQRLSDIAAFAGFTNKKCGTYLQALCDAGIIDRKKEPSSDRRSTTRYCFVSGYMALWARFLMIQQGNPVMELVKLDHVREYIDHILVPEHFWRLCIKWFNGHKNEYEIPGQRIVSEVKNDEGSVFDCVFSSGKKKIFLKIWTDLDTSYGAEEFKELDRESVRMNPFYDNIYCLFSIHRFKDSMWDISKQYENAHLIEARFLT